MSGICGIVALNGKPVGEAELGGMVAALEQRGPDRSNAWLSGSTAFGHTLLATTPEALTETLPLTHQPTGCTITADARLDNREDLIASIGTPDAIGDGELILRAYLKWGTGCADHLLGDFAFAIWDPREELLLCARDLIGMRQLNYHLEPGKLFAFATEPEAILRHPDVPRRINEGRIGDFLEDLEAYDLTSTFFDGIHRLPPAHAMILRDDGLRIWKYGDLAPQPLLKLPNDGAYAEAFLDVFTDAVRARLRSPDPVGSMLSGGMDSGSVTAVASQLLKQSGQPPLETFSAIGTDEDCRETRTIKAAQIIDHIDPQSVSLADMDAYREDLQRLVRDCIEPFDGHMTLLFAVYLAASREGRKVVLDGVGGDTTLGTQNLIAWHLRRGHFIQAWKEATGEERFWEHPDPAWKTLLRGAGQTFVPKSLREARRALMRRRGNAAAHVTSLLDPDFAARIGIEERKQRNAAHVTMPTGDGQADRARRMLHPYVTVARERYDRVASAMAIEPRDPFLDRRVMEFCLSLPADQLQKGGWPKTILRRSMEGCLPDSVRWRAGKEHLGWDFTSGLWQSASAQSDNSFESTVGQYICKRSLNPAEIDDSEDDTIAHRLSARYLANWLSTWGRVDFRKKT
ncbi:asparagine synthase-related protein [uncultured Erythrobacter sp.]|uniref:asparagine synthase-related protein n=1 Tax=uncultured Erythrobacter sp. TaxID=263913 RepID=UPI00261857F3|nr:asparagine synthase-related protein [uncultured Erythrobacter sp.]